jgi:hypothetical protein
MKTAKDILKDRAKFHPEAAATYAGVLVTHSQDSVLACGGCAWCSPEPEDWKAHDEAKRILRMTEKVK